MIDKALQEFVLTKLNAKQDIFVGGYLFYNDQNGNLTVYRDIENTYQKATIDVVGMSALNYVGEQQPIPSLEYIKYTIPFQFLVEVDKIDEVVGYINSFQNDWRGKTTTITVGEKTYNTVFNFTPIDRAGGVQQHSGKLLLPISFTMFTTSTDKKLDNGNDLVVKIGSSTLPKLNFTTTVASTNDDLETFTGFRTTTTKIGEIWTASCSTYLDLDDATQKAIRDSLYTGNDTQYTLSMQFGTDAPITKTVIISNYAAPYELGAPTVYTLVFKEV